MLLTLTLPFTIIPANFKSGEKQLNTLIRGIWMRKRRDRLAAEPGAHVEDADFS